VLGHLFARNENAAGAEGKHTSVSRKRFLRHSSGWGHILAKLKSEEGLRVLDVGPTSPGNINFLTGLGHSVFMSDVVESSAQEGWTQHSVDGAPDTYDVDAFLKSQMDFGTRTFDVVLLWDTLDHVPTPLVPGILGHLHASMVEGGEILAMFHTQQAKQRPARFRYHVTDGDSLEAQELAPVPMTQIYSNRAIEKLFSSYRTCRSFLAKDNIYEVIVTR
jgi:2-polyprenyl-3-methyl-5-hydroxy-6-metoxy-1,4-benzoquinol methylase